jgi:antirestriction protein ArdC
LPALYYALAEKRIDPIARIAHAENFFAATGASLT